MFRDNNKICGSCNIHLDNLLLLYRAKQPGVVWDAFDADAK
jgi:hypothetical protein